jgi:YD repeat-containing protein
MSDLAQWNVHGPVETLRTEFAEWDSSAQAWGSASLQTLLQFLPDGRLKESGDPGGLSRTTWIYDEAGRLVELRFQGVSRSIFYSYDDSGRLLRIVNVDEKGTRSESETYHYDSGGRKTKIQFLPKIDGNVPYSYDVEGAGALMMSGTAAKTMTTSYDDHNKPTEILVHDDTHRLLRRMTFTYDSAGRLVKEEVHADAEARFPGFEEKMKDASPEDRERLLATLRKVFGQDHGMLTTVYAYDEKGRRVEKTWRMGALSEHHTKSPSMITTIRLTR